ncbi:hypothetical protein DAEQUDRAFT_130447 [Daedalea quercina L-15889]|uniref:Uncharacterized protein n=1 Tax=Daedalea quercina L-15889 TaxID=1314783 RepID=A0A165S1R4_9APHY|nr:hypothetical protein DAEQUDRAFT_130447 [Daedalea quercina L-15889]
MHLTIDLLCPRVDEVSARDIPEHEHSNIVDMRKTLKSVRRTLQAVCHSMEQMAAERITHLEAEVRHREKENATLGEHAKELSRQRRRARKVATTQLNKERADFQAKESEIQAKLRRLKDDLSATKDELRQCEERRTQANEEMKLWRGSATKNKKKYYALKAQRSVAKKDNDSDDSLEVV